MWNCVVVGLKLTFFPFVWKRKHHLGLHYITSGFNIYTSYVKLSWSYDFFSSICSYLNELKT